MRLLMVFFPFLYFTVIKSNFESENNFSIKNFQEGIRELTSGTTTSGTGTSTSGSSTASSSTSGSSTTSSTTGSSSTGSSTPGSSTTGSSTTGSSTTGSSTTGSSTTGSSTTGSSTTGSTTGSSTTGSSTSGSSTTASSTTSTTTNVPSNQVNPAEDLVCVDYQKQSFKINDEITFCVHLIPRKLRMAFKLKVDQYSVVTITGAAYFVMKDVDVSNVYMISQISNYTNSHMAQYYKKDSWVVPVLNIVIKMDQGNITGIVWDNACFTCYETANCFNNTALRVNASDPFTYYDINCKQDICKADQDNVYNCDPKFYVTFWGSDSENRPLQSSGLAMSRFRQYNVASLYTNAKDVFNKTFTDIKNTFNDVQNKTVSLLNDIKKAFTG